MSFGKLLAPLPASPVAQLEADKSDDIAAAEPEASRWVLMETEKVAAEANKIYHIISDCVVVLLLSWTMTARAFTVPMAWPPCQKGKLYAPKLTQIGCRALL
eukprot:gnl/Chilomastix_cuspidata/7194.p1 GENE.gnl/Chilomastix_cuspidata/7194~~gnl/Chilomastix_cuspidata/7194.p1  ORF type:complete len:102 (-),score=5.89 gnl/Chilomastix_cuspidata/7194:199-504(-)